MHYDHAPSDPFLTFWDAGKPHNGRWGVRKRAELREARTARGLKQYVVRLPGALKR